MGGWLQWYAAARGPVSILVILGFLICPGKGGIWHSFGQPRFDAEVGATHAPNGPGIRRRGEDHLCQKRYCLNCRS